MTIFAAGGAGSVLAEGDTAAPLTRNMEPTPRVAANRRLAERNLIDLQNDPQTVSRQGAVWRGARKRGMLSITRNKNTATKMHWDCRVERSASPDLLDENQEIKAAGKG